MCAGVRDFGFLTLLLAFEQVECCLHSPGKSKKRENWVFKNRCYTGNVTVPCVVTKSPHSTCTESFNPNLNEEDIWSPKFIVLKAHSVYLFSRAVWTAHSAFHFSFYQSSRRENIDPRQAAEDAEWLQNFCQLTATFTPSVQKAHAGRTVQSPATLLLF